MATITDQAKNNAANSFVSNSIRVRAHSGDPGPDGLLNMTNGVADILREDFELKGTGETGNNDVFDLGYLNEFDSVRVTHLSIWSVDNVLYAIQELKSPTIVAANRALTINEGTINFKFTS